MEAQFKTLLNSAGFKATPPRLKLLSVLEKAEAPLSIQEIIRRFKSAKVDQVTVYRTLKTLADIGLVRQVDLRHAHAHFELMREIDHHHLVCTNCGKIEDFGECDMGALSKKVLKKSKLFKTINEHSLELFGLCKECSKKKYE